MLAKTYSYGLAGLEAYPVTIEIDVARSLPSTIIVGLPDNAVRESKERVRAAIKNSGFKYKPQRVTVNLSPADIKKEGPSFDLGIALGILAATEQIPTRALADYIFLGELSLDGNLRPITGALPISLAVSQKQFKGLIVPHINAAEAAVNRNLPVYPASSLAQIVQFLNDPTTLTAFPFSAEPLNTTTSTLVDFADVKGQTQAKRGLEIACAGGHNCLLIGSPGSGKTMLAQRIPTILPAMTFEETLETTKIHSVMGLVSPGEGLLTTRPFRAPHHTASNVALVGGGSIPKPGEVSLSHNGVLFLDELPEFNRSTLESLRQPLEDHYVTVARAAKTLRFPAKFMLISSMNPCPCGFLNDPRKECHCSPQQIQRYLAKISGPLLDRIDIHLDVQPLPASELLKLPHAETSATIRERTTRARERQLQRFSAKGGAASGGNGQNIFANAQMSSRLIEKFCPLTKECRDLLHHAVDELGLSARAHDKILKVAKTISDLEGTDDITPTHIAEAIQYRSLDRNWWG